MSMKKYFGLISILISMLLIVSACGGSESASSSDEKKNSGGDKETYTLKFLTGYPVESTHHKRSVEPFIKRVEELTDGRVQFEVYPGEQLGKVSDAISLTSSGVADIAFGSAGYTPSEMPLSANLIGMPGLYDNAEQASKAYWNIAQKSPMLETDFLRHGVRPVIVMGIDTYDIFTNGKEVKVPSDLKGMKIRGGGGVLTEALSFAGANPVTLAANDLYQSFERGVVDGIHMASNSANMSGLGEVIKYGTRSTGFSGNGVYFIINENLYQSMPKDIQEAIMQAGKEVSASSSKGNIEDNKTVFDQWTKEGIKIHEVSEKEKQEWDKFYKDFSEAWLKKQNNKELDQVYKMFKEEMEKVK
jgi:TRAP-type C4-dicarboxylate transport system substrate-binding protein